MKSQVYCWSIFYCWSMLLILHAQGQIKIGGKDGLTKVSFKTPDLTDEESYSLFLPESMKCDACQAIAYQLYKKFTDFNAKNKQFKYKLPESEVIDLIESVCSWQTFEHYGLKEVDGVNKLTGDGLEANNAHGVTSGGGKWPSRLQHMCGSYVEEFSESEIYDLYLNDPKSLKSLVNHLCRGEGVLGECSKAIQPSFDGKKKKSKTRSVEEL
jgi:hypothetical protein